jgi:hypothetical protein
MPSFNGSSSYSGVQGVVVADKKKKKKRGRKRRKQQRLKQLAVNVYAMRRSGNHAIIFWMLANLKADVKPVDDKRPYRDFVGKKSRVYYFNDVGTLVYKKFPRRYNYLFKSHEDLGAPPGSIIILRDFANMLSSRYNRKSDVQQSKFDAASMPQIISTWKQQAGMILSGACKGVLYNKWLHDKAYRDEVGLLVGIPNVVDNTSYISPIGGGSSFCGVHPEGNKSAYVQRYSAVTLPDEVLAPVLRDADLLVLNQTLFGIDLRAAFRRPEQRVSCC